MSDWSSDGGSSDLLASLVLVVGAAPGLSDFGSLRSSAVLRRGRLVLALVVLLGGMVLAERLGRDHYDLAGRYPIASLARLEQEDVDLAEVRLVTPDVVGNLLTALHPRSEEHTSELQSLMRISYAVFCLKKKKQTKTNKT